MKYMMRMDWSTLKRSLKQKGNIINKKTPKICKQCRWASRHITIGTDNQPICVSGDSTITVLGKLPKLVTKELYMVELAAHNNLPSGVVVNCSSVTPKAGTGGSDLN